MDRGNPVFKAGSLGSRGADAALGGFTLVSADDLEAAVALAKGCPQSVLNVPGPELAARLQRLGGSADPCEDGFAAAGLTPLASKLVLPPRVAECPLQLEAELTAAHPSTALPSLALVAPTIDVAIVELIIRHVHVAAHLLTPGAGGVDWESWSPLRSPRLLAT